MERPETMHLPAYSIDDILSTSWARRIALDLVSELENRTGEKRPTLEQMRRLLAVKGYRQLFERLQAARRGKKSQQAVRAVAHAMREFALERPALSAASFRSATSDSPEWREASAVLREFMTALFAECGLQQRAATQATCILRSIARGFVVHELMHSFLEVTAYEEAYENAIDVFLAGIPALKRLDNDHGDR